MNNDENTKNKNKLKKELKKAIEGKINELN
jgi:hypothetical protein